MDKALLVPRRNVGGSGVDIDTEIKQVTHRESGRRGRRGEHIEALDDHDVGVGDEQTLPGHAVVEQVGVNRRLHRRDATFYPRDKAQQGPSVITLGETFALEKTFSREFLEG